jgi:hypothetical protein
MTNLLIKINDLLQCNNIVLFIYKIYNLNYIYLSIFKYSNHKKKKKNIFIKINNLYFILK